MKRTFLLFLLVLNFLAITTRVAAVTYYVSPSGASGAAGTISAPLTFTAAIAKTLTGGDSIIVRGGIYNFSTMQTISKSGNSSAFLTIAAYPGEVPVFDFRTQAYASSNQGVKISGNYVHFKGIIMQGAGDNGMQVTGSNNKIEHCTFRWNCDSGLQMKTGGNNLILNCDSYDNFDYMTGGTSSPDYGGNADGFADKQYTNTGANTYRGCRAWRNSDDGWDGYEKIGTTIYESSWCYANGPASYDMTDHIRFKTDSAAWISKFKNAAGRYVITNYGNGNGFKLGGNYTASNATLTNCIAVANKIKGFDQNNNNGAMTLYNCTGYNNQTNYGFSNSSYGTLVIRNSASLATAKSNAFNAKSVTQSHNSWNTGFSCTAADFVSLEQAQMILPRKSDGSLPDITLLKLVASSGMIDKGMNVGLPFYGTAPDLGAIEYSPATSNPTVRASLPAVPIFYSSASRTINIGATVSKVEIFNLSGNKLFVHSQQTDALVIPAGHLPKGLLLVRVTTAGGVQTQKVLVD